MLKFSEETPLKDVPTALLNGLISAVSTAGKQAAMSRYGKKTADYRPGWEGYHFIAYVRDFYKRFNKPLEQRTAKEILERCLIDQGFSDGVSALDKLPNPSKSSGISQSALERLLAARSNADGVSSTECLLGYFEFCKKMD